MSSENKKRKARNSFMHNGGEKTDTKLKRINYYKKRDRNRIKREQRDERRRSGNEDADVGENQMLVFLLDCPACLPSHL